MADKQDYQEQIVYHIVVDGRLDQKWAEWFTSFEMTPLPDGRTLFIGQGVDQAALHGALAKIHSLGLCLELVKRNTNSS